MAAPSPTRSAPAPEATRAALLRAAGAVFAEHGYREATVRDICERAGANVAAVNYHFGDKEELYVQVLRHAMAEATARHPFEGGLPSDAPAVDRLRAFVTNFLGRILDGDDYSWFGRLMAREMIEPTRGLDTLLEERIRPMAAQLRGIIGELAGPGIDEDTLWLCGFSIVSQCLFYNHCRSVVSRLRPDFALDASGLERIAGHITRFSLAALEAARVTHAGAVRPAGRPVVRRSSVASRRRSVKPSSRRP